MSTLLSLEGPMIALGLFFIFCGLQLADAATTYAFIRLGLGREGNPVVRRLMDSIGILPALIVMKAIVIAPAWYFLGRPFTPGALAVMVGFYLLVVHNNLRIILRARIR